MRTVNSRDSFEYSSSLPSQANYVFGMSEIPERGGLETMLQMIAQCPNARNTSAWATLWEKDTVKPKYIW